MEEVKDVVKKNKKKAMKELNKELDISDDTLWKYNNDINESYGKDVERAYQE